MTTRPVILSGGISAAMVGRWPGLTFDRHVADILSGGDSVAAFLGMPPRDLARVLPFLDLAGRGLDMFPLGEIQHVGVAVSLLWRCGVADAGAVLSHPAIALGPLAGRMLVLPAPDPGGPGGDPAPRRPADAPAKWSAHLSQLLAIRLCRARFDHVLDAAAARAHGEFRQECASAAAAAASPRARAHPHAVPDLALRVALGIHLAGPGQDQPGVSGETCALAARIAGAASGIHQDTMGRFCPAQVGDRDPPDLDIEIMVTKIRIRGSCTRRELFRAYHRQDYPRLENILAAAIAEGRIVPRGERLLPAPIDDRQRVSPSAEGEP